MRRSSYPAALVLTIACGLPATVGAQERVPPSDAAAVTLENASTPARIEIVVDEGPGRIEVVESPKEVLRYRADGSKREPFLHRAPGGAIQLVGRGPLERLRVWVPVGSNLRIENRVGGEIDLEGITGQVEIINYQGSVQISGAPAALVTSTTNGSVRIRLDRWGGTGPYSVAIDRGSLFLTLPPDVGVDLDTRTLFEGELTTSLARRVTETPSGPRTRIGRGGPTLHVSLWNGSLHIDSR